jgi:hypothetical protein
MAGRILNRRKLRDQAEQSVQSEADTSKAPAGEAPPTTKPKKAPAARKAPAPRKKAAKKPSRLRARWALFDSGMKQVAIFDYSQRAEADAALADVRQRKKGLYFLQIVKDALPEAVPASGMPLGKPPSQKDE